jgi:hypothetical protein
MESTMKKYSVQVGVGRRLGGDLASVLPEEGPDGEVNGRIAEVDRTYGVETRPERRPELIERYGLRM